MTMLACARRRVQSGLLRPFAFSTTVPKQDEEFQEIQSPVIPTPPEDDPMKDLTNILQKAGDRVSPIIPGTSHSDQSV
jgi:hypothetical protein